MQPEHLLQEGLAGPVTGHVHECRKGDEDKGIVAIRSPDLLLEPQVRSLGPFFPSPLRSGNRGFLQQGRKAGGGRKEELLFPLPVQSRIPPRTPPPSLLPEQTPEVREGRVAVPLPAPFPQVLQKLQGYRLEIRRPLPRGEDLLHPFLDILSVGFLAASREQVDACLPPRGGENVPEGACAWQRGDDRLLQVP